MFALIGWIGRIILIMLIVRLVVSMFSTRKTVPAGGSSDSSRGGRGDRGAASEKAVAKLVRDPQCGTYVAENTAIAARHGGEIVHFCSDRCRDEYLASPRASAS
jgi:YHS domain-containing protein